MSRLFTPTSLAGNGIAQALLSQLAAQAQQQRSSSITNMAAALREAFQRAGQNRLQTAAAAGEFGMRGAEAAGGAIGAGLAGAGKGIGAGLMQRGQQQFEGEQSDLDRKLRERLAGGELALGRERLGVEQRIAGDTNATRLMLEQMGNAASKENIITQGTISAEAQKAGDQEAWNRLMANLGAEDRRLFTELQSRAAENESARQFTASESEKERGLKSAGLALDEKLGMGRLDLGRQELAVSAAGKPPVRTPEATALDQLVETFTGDRAGELPGIWKSEAPSGKEALSQRLEEYNFLVLSVEQAFAKGKISAEERAAHLAMIRSRVKTAVPNTFSQTMRGGGNP